MKKFLTILLTVVLTAAVAITGTVAYLTAEDSDVNVMTLGNVKIEQHEYERELNADGTYKTATIDEKTSYVLKDFTQDKPLLPIVGDPSEPGDSPAYAGWDNTTVRMSQVDSYGGMDVFAGKNAQDKFVTVENTGKSDAYVRTLVAIEVGSADPDLIGTSYHQTWTKNEIGTVVIGGNNYMVYEYVYRGASDVNRHVNGILPAGETTYPSLAQVYLKHNATNEDMVAIDGNNNGKLDILVLSQAVQADGFADAQTALDTAFGEVNANNAELKEAFLGSLNYTVVSTAEELDEAIETAAEGKTTTIVLANDVVIDNNGSDVLTVKQNAEATVIIDGNGNDFDGVLLVDGGSKQDMTAGFTIRNVNFVADNISTDACIQLGNGTNTTRYTCNVTVEDCTFDVPGAVGVKSYTGGDKNTVIRNCTATANAHSLAQLKGIDGVLVENCTVNSVRGINLNNSINVTIKDSTFDVQKYAVRFGESANTTVENYEIINCNIKSANVEGDAAIVLRAGATNANLTLDKVTITAGIEMSGHDSANVVIK